MKPPYKIIITGAGGIGRAVALLIANYPEFSGELWIGDRDLEIAQSGSQWVREGRSHPIEVDAFAMPDSGLTPEFQSVLAGAHILLDCLPGSEAPRMAAFALQYGMHYVNLTEYVHETHQIVEFAKNAKTGFVLQTGLAPGFINILANKLYRQFSRTYDVEKVERVAMRVGGLTHHAESPHYYGFTWSPIGVATEYVKRSIVIRDFQKTELPALSEREHITIDGRVYEADLTSGGAADIPSAFEGVARSLDNKTLRYPGHFDWVLSVMPPSGSDEDKIQTLLETMQAAIPTVEEDLIVLYAGIKGFDRRNVLRKMEKSYHIRPLQIGGKMLRAIQATTAAPMAECARLLLGGKWQGVVLPSQIDPFDFMVGPFVELVYRRTQRQNGMPVMS